MLRYIIFLFFLIPLSAVAQTVTGRIVDSGNKPLSGASVIWLNNKKGFTAKADGGFSIKKTTTDSMLVVSHSGYASDTMDVSNLDNVVFVLKTKGNLQAVVVNAEKAGTIISNQSPFKM